MTTPDSAPAVALEPKTKLSGKILKTTLAGALVDIGQSLPGVIHISQLQQEAVNKVEDVVKEGQTVEVWVRRVKKDRIELTMIEPLGFTWRAAAFQAAIPMLLGMAAVVLIGRPVALLLDSLVRNNAVVGTAIAVAYAAR